MFKKVVLTAVAAFAAFVVGFVIVVAMQPAALEVERSATIEAPPEVVFEQVDDFRNWESWSPWLQEDSDAEGRFDGAERGEGAIFEWRGTDEYGAGRMTIVESRPTEYIEIKLEFFEPYESVSTTFFGFEESGGGGTDVTWSMYSEHNFMSKAISLFMDVEEMIGEDYQEGLSRLDEVVQASQ